MKKLVALLLACMLILAAGDARIDNHKFKEKFHMKAKMLSADEVLVRIKGGAEVKQRLER